MPIENQSCWQRWIEKFFRLLGPSLKELQKSDPQMYLSMVIEQAVMARAAHLDCLAKVQNFYLRGCDASPEHFAAHVFYNTDADIAACEHNGTSESIKQIYREEIERTGLVDLHQCELTFNFHSRQTVQRLGTDYNGYLR